MTKEEVLDHIKAGWAFCVDQDDSLGCEFWLEDGMGEVICLDEEFYDGDEDLEWLTVRLAPPFRRYDIFEDTLVYDQLATPFSRLSPEQKWALWHRGKC